MSYDSCEPLQFDIEVSAAEEDGGDDSTVEKSPLPCRAQALDIGRTNDTSGTQNPGLEFFSDLLNANTIPAQPAKQDTSRPSKEAGCLSELWQGAAPPPPTYAAEVCEKARCPDDGETSGPDDDDEYVKIGIGDPGDGFMPPAPSCASRCAKHGAHLRVYCADDRQVMCVRCQISTRHEGHRILSDVEAAEEMQASHNEWLEKLTKGKERNVQIIEAIKKASTEAAAEADRARRRAIVQYQALIGLLEDERAQVLRLICEHQLEQRRRHELLVLAVVRETQAMQGAIDALHAVMAEQAMPHQTLQAFKAIQESLKGTDREPPELTQIQNNGLQTVTEFEVKISKLLKAFEPKPMAVTLDPETAHPNLEISANGAEVRCLRTRRDVAEEPGRFLSTLNVLACRGLPALSHHGCCYWEVVVSQKTGWTVGMAYASVPRADASRLGRNSASWALELHDGVCTAWHDGVAEPLLAPAVSKPPAVVGVLLVEGAGVLAFFNTASMGLLHAFHARFLEPLYPALNPHSCRERRNVAPLRLVQPERAHYSDAAAAAANAATAAGAKPSFKLVLSGLFG